MLSIFADSEKCSFGDSTVWYYLAGYRLITVAQKDCEYIFCASGSDAVSMQYQAISP